MKTTYFYLIIALCLLIGMVILAVKEYFILGFISGIIGAIWCGYCIAKLTIESERYA